MNDQRWSKRDEEALDRAMGIPHYPSQADRDSAAAGAGLIVIFVLAFIFTVGFVVGFAVRAVWG